MTPPAAPFLRLVLLTALAVALATGCRTASDAPPPADGVSVDRVPLAAVSDSVQTYTPRLSGPLRVLSATPRGAMRTLPERPSISVTLSRPVVPLGDAPPPPDSALTISPRVAGSFRWEGTQTLVFTPAEPLPPATPFAVTLHPVLSDRNGEALAEAYSWTFETPRPRVVSSEPANGARFADPAADVRVRFNLPVDEDAARGRFAGRNCRFNDVVQVGDSTLVFQTDRPAPRGESCTLVLEAGFPTPAGPLGMAEDAEIRFRVRPPLQLQRVDQPGYRRDPRLDPSRGVQLQFSTPVRFGDLREALTFDPDVTWPSGIESQDANESLSHTLPVRLDAETRYRLRIDGDLSDTFGQRLDRTRSVSFETRPYEPQLWMDSGRLTIEAEQNAVLPLRITNVGGYRVGVTALGPDDIIPALDAYDSSTYYPDVLQEQAADPVPPRRRVSLNLPRNEPSLVPLRLDSVLTGGSGLVGVHLQWDAPDRDSPRVERALATVTNLGVTGKFSPHQNLIVVTRLSDAQPVAGATVTIRDAQNTVHWTGETDAQGRAETPGWYALGLASESRWRAPTQFAIVEHEGDVAFTSSLYDDGVEPYRFGINYDRSPEPPIRQGSVFSDRGLYKAGDTVSLKGILRERLDGDWQSLTDAVRVLIRDPRDEIVYDAVQQPSPLGTFDLDWTATDGAAQGRYTVRVAAEADSSVYSERTWQREGIATGDFRIDSFRRATFAVDAQSAASSYVAGDLFEGTVSGRYLFGAGMEGQPVRYRLTQQNTRYRPPGHRGYRFGPLDGYTYETLAQGETVLDSSSTTTQRIPLPQRDDGQPTTLTWSGTVTGPSEQTISGRTDVTVHPGRFYIGLKPSTSFLDLSDSGALAIDVLTTDPGGAPVGGKSVDVRVVRKTWNSVREVGRDGRLRWRSVESEEEIQTATVEPAADAAQRLRLTLDRGGRYEIHATATDLRGNTIRTETSLYATGPGYVAWRRDDDDRIDLVPEKTNYAPGETARILVPSPYEEATALITVERDGILNSRVETLTGSAPQIEIPLAERHLPNVYVSVILLNGRTAEPRRTSDPGAPGFKIGYTQLRVDAGSRRLNVAVEPQQDTYRPGEEVTVDLRLTDASGDGVAGEIAFAAADASILNLIGYALPDPFDTFYGPRPLGVTTSETRANLVEQRNYGQKAEDVGGGGGSAQNQVRTDFRPLAHWAPALRTDSRGRASVTFRVPESLTTFRFMATALTADHRFGQGQTDITVTQPLVLQPAMPRFARMGDRFEAGVLVSNRTATDGTATVTAAAQGLTLTGSSERTVDVRAGATEVVRFAWDAETFGDATLQFRATLNGETDAFETTLPVRRPLVERVDAQFASVDTTAADEALRLPDDRVPGMGLLDMRLASTALVGLDGATDYLFGYPYGCLEQRTSRIRPLVLADNLLEAFDLTALDGDRNAVVADWMARLSDYWIGSGFGLWTGAYEPNWYATAYTVLALAEAEAAGYAVPQPLTQRAVDGLVRAVRDGDTRPRYLSDAAWADTQALMLYALVRHGRVLEGELSALAQTPPPGAEGQSLLLRALVAADRPSLARFRNPLADRLRRQIRVEATRAYLQAPDGAAYGWIFSSDARATAFGLTALIEHAPSGDFQQLAQRMIRYLMEERRNGHWASTQDNAAAVDAFRAYVDAYEQATPDFTAQVQLAGRTVLDATFQGRSLRTVADTLSMAQIPPERTVPIRVRKAQADRPGRLYYTLRLTTYTQSPVEARSQGIRVVREMQRLDDTGTPQGPWMTSGRETTVAPGTLLRIRLRLTSPTDRNYVVVDDALPAGLEPVNAAFATSDAGLLEAADTGQSQWWGSFNHTETRDDRVLLFADFLRSGEHTYTYVARATTPGTYIHPPADAEMMYAPETRGRTASGTFVVEQPVAAGR